MRDGLRLAGIRDHVDEDYDFGMIFRRFLHSEYEGPTPTTAPGVHTIRTRDLATLIERRKPLVLDTVPWGNSIPGAVGLWGAGIGGTEFDEFQDRLRSKMLDLTGGNRDQPVVAVAWNAERFQGRNLALRLAALGCTEVHWYRGGREAWETNNFPQSELVMLDW